VTLRSYGSAFRRSARALPHAQLAIGIAVALSCAACAAQRMAMYPGPERSLSDVATLAGSTHRRVLIFYNRTTEIRILAVDGQQIIASADELELLPGRHVVQAAYGTYRSILWGPGWAIPPVPAQTIEFVGEPGRRYRVDGQIVEVTPQGREFNAWIEDLDTGAVVGGSKQPQRRAAAAAAR
jgi:hypothetical protein